MDKFEQSMTNMLKRSPEKRLQETAKEKQICICPDCPTYNDCAKEAQELLYCVYGSSFHCIYEDNGCICPTCPVTDDLGLLNDDFCIKGSEAARRWTKRLVNKK
jgi:Protein of unknown function (DUF2769)